MNTKIAVFSVKKVCTLAGFYGRIYLDSNG